MGTTKHSRQLLLLALSLSLLSIVLVSKPYPTHSAQPTLAPTSAVHLAMITKPADPSGETPLPTASPTPLPTATASATATAMPTATPTATATPVTLRNCDNVYPIRVGAGLLDEQGFLPPQDPLDMPYYKTYYDPVYGPLSQRRVYLTDGNSYLNFGFVRWRADISSGSYSALTAALTGTGTLEQGFDEVLPWPDASVPAPADYPQRPHRLNSGDWIYGITEVAFADKIKQALLYHKLHHTILTLPIVGYELYRGMYNVVPLQRFGDFFLVDFGNTGSYTYLDLVFLRTPNPSPCTTD